MYNSDFHRSLIPVMVRRNTSYWFVRCIGGEYACFEPSY